MVVVPLVGGGVGLLGVESPDGSAVGAGFVRRSFKRVRLAKKTRCPIVEGRVHVSLQPVTDMEDHDPLEERAVARTVHGVSSPGGRLDQQGIG